MNIFVNIYIVLIYFNGFIYYLVILLLGENFIFDKAVYLQNIIMLLYKFIYTFSNFWIFFLI